MLSFDVFLAVHNVYSGNSDGLYTAAGKVIYCIAQCVVLDIVNARNSSACN